MVSIFPYPRGGAQFSPHANTNAKVKSIVSLVVLVVMLAIVAVIVWQLMSNV